VTFHDSWHFFIEFGTKFSESLAPAVVSLALAGGLATVDGCREYVSILVQYAFEANGAGTGLPRLEFRVTVAKGWLPGLLGFWGQLVADGPWGEQVFSLGYAGPDQDGGGLPFAVAISHPAVVTAA
jgi:hypothetical protein